jgi:branched-chain amino acid transport system ATP-binding protein
MALFEAHDLHLRFGDRVVLEDVSLAFEAGRLSGIMGPNGAGKTTCFSVLTGRYRPDRGSVVLDGRDITGRRPQEIVGLGVARSFQVMSLFDEFSVFENVAIALPASVLPTALSYSVRQGSTRNERCFSDRV